MATTNEKPGCLSVILSFFKRSQKDTTSKALPYRLRDDFLSPAEFSFYKVLSSLADPRFTIQTKVRLADIFFVARPNENIAFYNRIANKHLDFLVCDSVTMKPLFGVELDDSSHKQNNRQERDEFVDSVFKVAGLALLHFPVQREYNSREIAAQIAPLLKEKVGLSAPPPQPKNNDQAGSVPLCPKCGIPMVLRTAAQGEHKGKQFYGCPNYPRCREIKPAQQTAP
jgi:hypothetical protein